MNNTKIRIIAAIVLIIIVLICFFLGTLTVLALFGLVGVLIIDELYCNFLKKNRFALHYIIAELIFLTGFIAYQLPSLRTPHLHDILLNISMVWCLSLSFYLFFSKMDSMLLRNFLKKYSYTLGFFILIPLLGFSVLFYKYPEQVHALFWILFVINFGMDTGGWYFGKLYGNISFGRQ